MKIVIATKSFYGQRIGGAEYQSYLIAKFLIENGHDVHYLFLSTNQIKNYSSNIFFHQIKKINHIGRSGLETPLYFLKIINVLNKVKPDIIYLRGRSAISIICCIYAKIKKTKSIFHIAHDHDLTKPRIVFSLNNFLRYPEHKLFSYLIRNFDHIISQTNYQSKKLYNNFRVISHVIPNGHPQPNLNMIYKPNNPIKILWIANFKPMKQPDIFFNLANNFISNTNLQFIMIGRLNCKKNSIIYKKLHDMPNLNFLGELQNDQVNKYLEKAHILVNTSIAEGFSNTFIQAWMRKVPVVSLSVNPDGIINKYRLGFHSLTFEQLIKDVNTLATNQHLREEMGTRAQIFAFKHHTLTNILKVSNLIENSFEH